MTDFFKTKFTLGNVVTISVFVVGLASAWTALDMRVSAMEKELDQRTKQGDAAIELLHAINATLKEHLGEHRGRER